MSSFLFIKCFFSVCSFPRRRNSFRGSFTETGCNFWNCHYWDIQSSILRVVVFVMERNGDNCQHPLSFRFVINAAKLAHLLHKALKILKGYTNLDYNFSCPLESPCYKLLSFLDLVLNLAVASDCWPIWHLVMPERATTSFKFCSSPMLMLNLALESLHLIGRCSWRNNVPVPFVWLHT
jgi:hypothetical protein